jgi:hypothetical protein
VQPHLEVRQGGRVVAHKIAEVEDDATGVGRVAGGLGVEVPGWVEGEGRRGWVEGCQDCWFVESLRGEVGWRGVRGAGLVRRLWGEEESGTRQGAPKATHHALSLPPLLPSSLPGTSSQLPSSPHGLAAPPFSLENRHAVELLVPLGQRGELVEHPGRLALVIVVIHDL